MSTTIQNVTLIAKGLGWALLHSLWQGLLIAATLFAALKLLSRASAKIRYCLSASLLGVFFVLFINTLVTQWQKLQTVTVYVTESATSTTAAHSFKVSTIAPETSFIDHYSTIISPKLEYYFPLIATLYAIGLLLMTARFWINAMQLRGLRRKGLTAVEHSWDEWIEKYRECFNILRPVKVFLSERINVPMVMGTLRPIILLPFTSLSQLSTEQLETILMHELAHIKRHDYLLNILQTVVETILFFNPFMWWISTIVRREREHCCDDMVLANTNYPLSYARALATLETSRQQTYTMAVAATGQKNQLFNRIKRIMEMKKNSLNYSQLTITILIVSALVLSIICFSPSFAQTAKKKDAVKQETSTTIKKEKIIVIDDNGNKQEYNSISEMPKEQKEKLRKALENDEDVNGSTARKHIIINNNDEIDTGLSNTVNVAITNAMKNVDMQAIGKDVNDALKQVDWNALNKTMTMSFNHLDSNIDWKQIQTEIEAGMQEAQKALADAKVERELAQSKEEIKIAMEKARKSMAEARVAEVKAKEVHNNSYEKMIAKMEGDGLIDKAEGFTVKKKYDELYINGEKQPDAIYNKYAPYLHGDKIIIKGKDDGLTIDIHN
ncbi:MAG: M48 family metalloprotease [Bacteroidetes bacterium]|nr:M48 family metalloprotease [Bacteroidota bacterium]